MKRKTIGIFIALAIIASTVIGIFMVMATLGELSQQNRLLKPEIQTSIHAGTEEEIDTYVSEFYAAQSYEEQLELTEEYLEKYPKSSIALFNRAYLYVENDQSEEALLIYIDMQGDDYTDNAMYNNMAWAYSHLDYYDLATYYANKAIDANNGEPTFYELSNLGDSFFYKGDYTEAEKLYKQALYEYPIDDPSDMIDTYLMLGDCYKEMEDYPSAILAYEETIELYGANTEAFAGVIELLGKTGRVDEAIAYGEVYLSDNPASIEDYLVFANEMKALGEYDISAKYYSKYATLAGDPWGYYYAALCYFLSGDLVAAKTSLDVAIAIDSTIEDHAIKTGLWGELYE